MNITRMAMVRLLTMWASGAIECAPSPSLNETPSDITHDPIVLMERAALDRWGKGDPQGYLSIMAPDVTYFDPFTDRRLDGLLAVKNYIAPFTGKIHIDSYEMVNPHVERSGDLAVLTFNLVDEVKNPKITSRWNSTEIYRRTSDGWRIIHSHWSFVKPDLKPPAS